MPPATTAPAPPPHCSPAAQQPNWADPARLDDVHRELSAAPALVRPADVAVLRGLLARAARGRFQIVQAGDCAEDPAECNASSVTRKVGLIDMMAGAMRMTSGLPVLRVGRIAGQFAKPRSRPTEWIGRTEIEVYRGHQVNDPEPDAARRRADPARLLDGYRAARRAMGHLGWGPQPHGAHEPGPLGASETDGRVWTSHEALLLDYELPLVRWGDDGRRYLTSTHWPWVGERTRQVDGAHVELLASIANPVSCKVGPAMSTDDLVAVCERLDPGREPGRLTLILRLGADMVAERVPELVTAVRGAGHPVIWLVDPMHGNTIAAGDGLKTRFVDTVVDEVVAAQRLIRSAGAIPAGLHLESTPYPVTECVRNETEIDHVGDKYTSFCDPRLNPEQALAVVGRWVA